MNFKRYLVEENALFEAKMQKVQDDIYSGMTGPFKRHHKLATASSLEDFAKLAAQGHSVIGYKNRDYRVDGIIHRSPSKDYPGFLVKYVNSYGSIRITYAHNPKTDKMQLLSVALYDSYSSLPKAKEEFTPPPKSEKTFDQDKEFSKIKRVIAVDYLPFKRAFSSIKSGEKRGVQRIEELKQILSTKINNYIKNAQLHNLIRFKQHHHHDVEYWKSNGIDLGKNADFPNNLLSNKDYVVKLLLKELKNLHSNDHDLNDIKRLIKELRANGYDYPEFKVIEKSLNSAKTK